MKKCLYCDKPLLNRQTKYCDARCQHQYQSQLYVERWQQGLENGLKGEYGLSNHIRNYLLKKYNYQCQRCGWGEKNPYTDKCILEIHHKDGNYLHNDETNLQVLCPNCHALTENFRGANQHRSDRNRTKYNTAQKNYCIDCGKVILKDSIRCKECENYRRITDLPITREELKKLIRSTPFTKIGEKYGVSDNAIRKWCDKYNLPRKVSDIKHISNEDWEFI